MLEGGDWQRFRPRVVLVEATRPRTTVPTRGALAQARLLYQQLHPEVVDVGARTEAAHALFEAVGAGGLGVARRITQLSARHPKAGTTVKQGLRVALAVKRRLGPRP